MVRVAPSLEDQLSRVELVGSPHIRFALLGTFVVLTGAVSVLSAVMPGVTPARLELLALALALATAVLFCTPTPRPDSVGAHALLALTYVAPALAIWAFAPLGSAAVAAGMFVGPLVAMWSTRRRDQVCHLVAATLALFTPYLLGAGNTETLVACLALAPAVWVLAGSTTVILETTERQSERLAMLTRRDPLTGVGNRRLLDEQLEVAGDAFRATHTGFSILTLDLDGFKELNDQVGHPAGDRLLRGVATALTAALSEVGTVVRQGGDEFAVVLPGADDNTATELACLVRQTLDQLLIAGIDCRVSGSVGQASCPTDGTAPDDLLAVADERLRADKAARRFRDSGPAVPGRRDGAVQQEIGAGDELNEATLLDAGIGRIELQDNRFIWACTVGMYLAYCVLAAGVLAWAPDLVGPFFWAGVLLGGCVAAAMFAHGPTRIGSVANHVAIATTYVVPAVILVTCQPGGSIAIGCLVFVGPLAAARLVDRRQIAAHLIAASVLLLGLIPTGLVDPATMVAILLLVGTMWVLGVCSAIVLEAAEAQTRQLRILVGRDPLTGAGNRRALDELVAREVHGRSPQRPVTVFAFDFDGFKQLNDTLGHAAGDALLTAAARALSAASSDGERVFRQGGDEFCIVRSTGELADIPARIASFRDALAALDCNGGHLTTGVGWASAPQDGTDHVEVLAAADARLLADKRSSPARRLSPSRGAGGAGRKTHEPRPPKPLAPRRA